MDAAVRASGRHGWDRRASRAGRSRAGTVSGFVQRLGALLIGVGFLLGAFPVAFAGSSVALPPAVSVISSGAGTPGAAHLTPGTPPSDGTAAPYWGGRSTSVGYVPGLPVRPAAGTPPAGNAGPARSASGPASRSVRGTPSDPTRSLGPHPQGFDAPTGTISGYVNDSRDRSGIEGITVSLDAPVVCPASTCASTITAPDGSFQLTCAAPGGPADDDTVVADEPGWWMGNQTYAACVPNTNIDVGTLFLVRDASVVGVFRDAVTGKPVVGVLVVATTRDGSYTAFPYGASITNGSFEVALPPQPSIVSFSPPVGYEPSFNYTNATPGTGSRPGEPPWSGGINLGTIYLEPQTLVRAELINSVTGSAVTAVAAMEPCDPHGSGCGTQGAVSVSGTVSAFANPGDEYFTVLANGFMQTATASVRIPAEPLGRSFDLGKVYVIPPGEFQTHGGLSTPAGGTAPPWGAPDVPSGSIYATVCSLDGYATSVYNPLSGPNLTSSTCVSTACWNLGATPTLPGPPLRDSVVIGPDSTGYCTGGVAAWAVPGFTPVWPNSTAVNLTAGALLTPVVDVNLTPGDYVAGTVAGIGGGAPPGSVPTSCWTVAVASTDNEFYGAEGYDWASCLGPSLAPCDSVVPNPSSSWFCLAVPPGNSRISVSALNYATNWTWVHVPDYCCRTAAGGPGYPARLVNATAPGIRTINITTAWGQVYGYVETAGIGNTTFPTITVEACPAPYLQPVACQSLQSSGNAFYDLPAPVGIDEVTVEAAGFSPNRVWVNVTAGGNESVGTIPLEGLGLLSGRVVDPEGNGLYAAGVSVCPIATESACLSGGGSPLGPTGMTGTDGRFNGSVPGGWLPWASYVVVATAPGYTTDWTFGNVSAFGVSNLTTLVLRPFGSTGSAPDRLGPVGVGAGAAGVWVTGRLLDGSTGAGLYLVPGSAIALCPYTGALCVPVSDGTNSEGFFNVSVSPGVYLLNVTVPGYVPGSVTVNATLAGVVDVGAIPIASDPWVSGQLVIGPWSSITESSFSGGGPFGHGYGPSAEVTGCAPSGTGCQSGQPVTSNGSYNITVPAGPGALLQAVAIGSPGACSAAGGFTSNSTSTNLSGMYTRLTGSNAVLPLPIFGVLSGTVWNNDTISEPGNPHFPAADFGLPYASVALFETGRYTASVACTTRADGTWVAFLPAGDGPNATHVSATAAPAYTQESGIVPEALVSGSVVAADVADQLSRFGWIVGNFTDSAGGAPVPGVAASASLLDLFTSTAYSDSDTGNYAGFLNLTAPFGAAVLVTLSAPDFNGSNFTVANVRGSATTDVANRTLASFGWALSSSLAYSDSSPPIYPEPIPSVRDAVHGWGLPFATVKVASSDPSLPDGQSYETNGAGQFFSEAPIGPSDTFQVTADAYVTNKTILSFSAGEYRKFPTVNLTGDTVLAGIVTAIPSGRPIAGASVQACIAVRTESVCENTTTNASGAFWIAVTPGTIDVGVSESGFLTNETVLEGCSDCWTGVGAVNLSEFATVSGTVRGLPSGLPIAGASATLCSPLGTPVGPCAGNVTTGPDGGFAVPAPPGEYVLMLSDPAFNTTYLPVALGPGESTEVGTLFLEAFGTVTGRVYDASTFAPIIGAVVDGCNQWAEGTCAPAVDSDATGTYTFGAAPGTYNLTASAGGHQSGTVTVRIAAGETVVAPPLELAEIGSSDSDLTISGIVLGPPNVAGISVGLGGALVSALLTSDGSTSAVGSGTTGSSGASLGTFSFPVPFGRYTLVASDGQAPGYRPDLIADIGVFDDVEGVTFHLAPMTFPVTGTVTDALSHDPVAGVSLAAEDPNGSLGPALATTDASGTFDLALSNGTHALEATPGPSGGTAYLPTGFTVAVNGRSQVDNVTLSPPMTRLTVAVDDAATGLAIAGAVVTVSGTVEPGVSFTRTVITGLSGTVGLPVPKAAYLVTASVGGYRTAARSVTLTANRSSVSLDLEPVLGTTTVPSAPNGPVLWAAVAGSLALVGIGVLWAARRSDRRAAPTPQPLRTAPEQV